MPSKTTTTLREEGRHLIGIDETQLWSMADALRGSMDAAEYKHVVLGLIFLKYISDAFEERHAAVLDEWGQEAAEDPDEYAAESIFWVPPEARWAHLKAQARQASDQARHGHGRRQLGRRPRPWNMGQHQAASRVDGLKEHHGIRHRH